MSFGKNITTDFNNTQDTIPTFLIRWNNSISETEKRTQRANLEAWLKVRLNDDKVNVINY
jgi:hypothetical protein